MKKTIGEEIKERAKIKTQADQDIVNQIAEIMMIDTEETVMKEEMTEEISAIEKKEEIVKEKIVMIKKKEES